VSLARGASFIPIYPTPKTIRHNALMSFSLAPFVFALTQAVQLHARVIAQSGLLGRPEFVRKAVAARLRAGVRALEAFLRRILILMALDIERDLVCVWQPENLARAKARKVPRLKKPVFRIYAMPDRPYSFDFEQKFGAFCVPCASDIHSHAAILPPVTVPIARWLERLDYLHAIANDPINKARRLAFSLARSRHGLLMAPPGHPRVMRGRGTEATAIYDAMAFQIMAKSRSRPPPLPPPRRGPKPMITVFY
jgi:hypothetical protein